MSGAVQSDTSKLDKITYVSVCEATCIDVALTQPTIRGVTEMIIFLLKIEGCQLKLYP